MASELDSELCSTCSKIDFDHLLRFYKSADIHLGYWDDIQDRQSCPFCRLVVQFVQSWPHRQPGRRTEIKLNNDLC